MQDWLLAADARGQNIPDFAFPVPDQPFSADQLYRLIAEIGEPHGIRPYKQTALWIGVFREVLDVADNGKHVLGFDGGPEYVDVSIGRTIGQRMVARLS